MKLKATRSLLGTAIVPIAGKRPGKASSSTKAKEEILALAAKALPLISRSEDDVSKRLAPLYDKAVEPNSPEMGGARYRQELGNPPGKRWPLGDQITWEQLLTYCKKENVQRLWIATSDGDFITKFGERVWLNPFLHQDVIQACGDGVEVRCFDNLMTAITDFVEQTGVKADKLPSKQRSKEIEKQIHDLPPFVGWDDGTQIAIRAHWAREAAIGSGYFDFLGNRPLPLAAISAPEKDEGGQ
jgi:hypothetical protein